MDPVNKKPIPLHLLWDSNIYRSTASDTVEKNAGDLVKKHPRSAFPELKVLEDPGDFEKWARESYDVALEFSYGYGIETVTDPEMDPEKAVRKWWPMIDRGVSPLEDAPEGPAEYWDKLQQIVQKRITLGCDTG